MNVGIIFKKGTTLDFSSDNFIMRINNEIIKNKTPENFPDYNFVTLGDWSFKYKNVVSLNDKLFIYETGISPVDCTLEEGLEALTKWINTHLKM